MSRKHRRTPVLRRPKGADIKGKTASNTKRVAAIPETDVAHNGAKITKEPVLTQISKDPQLAGGARSLSILIVFDPGLIGAGVQPEGQWRLWEEIANSGTSCHIVSWIAANLEDRAAWLATREITLEATDTGSSQPFDLPGRELLRLHNNGVQFLASAGGSDAVDEPRIIVDLVRAAVDRFQPDVVIANGAQAPLVLDTARRMGVFAAYLMSRELPRDPGALRAANVIIAPSRFAAEYLRDAFSLPAVFLPPPICETTLPVRLSQSGNRLVFDAMGTTSGASVFVQIAEEIGRQRPNLPITICGESVTIAGSAGVILAQSKPLERAEKAASLEHTWDSARVLVAPILSWEHVPFASLAAICRGIPAVVSDLPGMREMFGEAALFVSVPERVTAAAPAPLTHRELAPWVDAICRLYDDASFAAAQIERANVLRERYRPDRIAALYVDFLDQATQDHRRHGHANNYLAESLEVEATGAFSERFPWPTERPLDGAPGEEEGWFGAGTDRMLAETLPTTGGVVAELGSWLGLSTRFIARHSPELMVVAIDHWEGSPEHKTQERFQKLLPRLYETFLSRCWDYRNQIVPIRANSLDGLRAIAESGAQPAVVFIDAEHSFEAVSAELELARELFPETILCGDDYDWKGVRQAVDRFAREQNMIVSRFDARGWRLQENWQLAQTKYPPATRGQCAVLVPYMGNIENECEQALRQLEHEGIRVVRRGGCSAIDVARNDLASEALHTDAEAILFIDSDVGFDPQDALRLFARPEPVVCAIYPKKGRRELASIFADGTRQVLFGPDATGLYPLKYAAAGFLRVRTTVLRRMTQELALPLCNTYWGAGVWPFFQPMIVQQTPEHVQYLGEDWAFCHRLMQIGVTPMADTTIRLWHWGRYGFGWEDAGNEVTRYRSFAFNFGNA